MYCAGGNNQGKLILAEDVPERNAERCSMGGSIRLYLRPNYPNPKSADLGNISENNQTVFL